MKCNNICKAPKENICDSWILDPTELSSFKSQGKVQIFSDKMGCFS